MKSNSKPTPVPPLLAQIAFQVELVPAEDQEGPMHARIHFGIRLQVNDTELNTQGQGHS